MNLTLATSKICASARSTTDQTAGLPLSPPGEQNLLSKPRSVTVTEIRVAWHFGLHENQFDEPCDGGVWFPDTPDNRRDLVIVVEAGNEVAGPGTHWLEERQA